MLTKEALGAAIEAARLAKGISKADLARKFGVAAPSVSGWVRFGRIDKANLFALIQYFSDTVGPDHWGMPVMESVDPRLSVLILQLTEDLNAGLLQEEDITMLTGLAMRIAGRNG